MTEKEVLQKLEIFKKTLIEQKEKINSQKKYLKEKDNIIIDLENRLKESIENNLNEDIIEKQLNEIQNLKDKIFALENDKTLINENKTLQDKIDLLETKNKEILSDIDNITKEKEQIVKDLVTERGNLSKEREKLSKKIVKFEKENNDLKKLIEQYKADIVQLKKDTESEKISIKEKKKDTEKFTTYPYRLGRTSVKVKDRFVDFVKKMYDDGKVPQNDKGLYLLKDMGKVSIEMLLNKSDQETIINVLNGITYKDGSKLIDDNGNSKLSLNEFIDWITFIVED